MLIAQLPGADGRPRDVAAVGSCRLYEPFLAGVHAGRHALIHSAATPFTYSAGELGQYLDFCSGRIEIGALEWPYVFSDPRTAVPRPEAVEVLAATRHFVAEISTLDQLRWSGRYLNWNELGLRLVRGRGPAYARWWRELTDRRRRRASAETVAQVLEARSAAGEDCSETVAAFLGDTWFETLDEAGLSAQLGKIVADHGGEWLFVAHLNVAEAGPEVLPDRRRLLEMLRAAAERLGHRVFDPTPTLVRYDWRRALMGDGADKHHYTPDFKPVLGRALMAAVAGMASGQSRVDVAALRAEAEAAKAEGRWADAAAAWERLRAAVPDDAAGFVFGAEALGRAGRIADAERLSSDGVSRFPEHRWIAHAHADLPALSADWDEAARRWAAVSCRFPDDPQAIANRARALKRSGAADAALVLFRDLADRHPDVPDGWIGLGEEAQAGGRWREASGLWRDVRARFPELQEGWGFGCEAAERLDLLDEADALAAEGRSAFPSSLWLAHLWAGLAQRRLAFAVAAERWRDVRGRFPFDAVAYERGGEALREAGQAGAAREVLARAVIRFPDRPQALALLSEIAMDGGAWAEAALHWAEMRRRFPERDDGYERGAEALRSAELVEEADALDRSG